MHILLNIQDYLETAAFWRGWIINNFTFVATSIKPPQQRRQDGDLHSFTQLGSNQASQIVIDLVAPQATPLKGLSNIKAGWFAEGAQFRRVGSKCRGFPDSIVLIQISFKW